MHYKIFAAVAATFCTGLSAQSYCTAPEGHLTKSGDYASWYPFSFMDGRVQLIDPSVPKGSKAIFTRIDYRTQKKWSYSSHSGQGRKWSKMTLALGHANCSKTSSTFSKNALGATTVVLSGSFSLPTIASGIPAQTWGNAGKLPFTTSFAFNGTDDLLMDYTFVGGKLANGREKFGSASYYVDGNLRVDTKYLWPYNPDAPGSRYVPSSPGSVKCYATGASYPPYVSFGANVYCHNHDSTSMRGMLQAYFYSYYTVPGAPVLAALTLGGSDTGLDMGAKCNKLHVNMKFPLYISTVKAAVGSSQFARHMSSNSTKWDNSLAGLSLFAQAAWAEPKTAQLGLSTAAKVVLPKLDLTGVSHPRACMVYRYAYTSNSVYRHWPSETDTSIGYRTGLHSTYNPIERFGKK